MRDDGSAAVRVHAVVRDREGNSVSDRHVIHVWEVEDGLVTRMDVEDDVPD